MNGQCGNEIIQYTRTCIVDTLLWFESYRSLLHILTVSFLFWTNTCGHCHLRIVTDIYTRLTTVLFTTQRRESGIQERTLRSHPTVFTIHHTQPDMTPDQKSENQKRRLKNYVHSSRYHTQTRCTSRGLNLLQIINNLENRQ